MQRITIDVSLGQHMGVEIKLKKEQVGETNYQERDIADVFHHAAKRVIEICKTTAKGMGFKSVMNGSSK